MSKSILGRFALAFALMCVTVPAGRMHAQSTASPGAVTGTDPKPPGEPPPPPPPPKTNATPSVVIAALIMLGLA